MLIQLIIAGMSLGMLSSFHCVGMCGPLIMALPVNHLSVMQRSLALLLYHSGRIFIYVLLGFIFSTMGRGVYLAGLQQYFSIVVGIVMLIIAGYYFVFKNAHQPAFVKSLYKPIHRLMGLALSSGKLSGFLLLGIGNGMLPCGMVYLAIAGALSFTEVAQGVIFMGAYGIGTLPTLLLLSIFSIRVSLPLRNTIKKGFPLVVMAMAIILILRGLNLGIPFISPILPGVPNSAILCH